MRLRRLLPVSIAELAGMITLVLLHAVRDQAELERLARSAPGVQVRGPVIVAWARFLEQVNDTVFLDGDAMREYEAMGPAPRVPEPLIQGAIGTTDADVARLLQETFAYDRSGNAGVREQVGAALQAALQTRPPAPATAADLPVRGVAAPPYDVTTVPAAPDVLGQTRRVTDAAAAAQPVTAGTANPIGGGGFVGIVHNTATAAPPVTPAAGHLQPTPSATPHPPNTEGADPTEARFNGRLAELELVAAQPTPEQTPAVAATAASPEHLRALLDGRARLVVANTAPAHILDERSRDILAVTFVTSFPYGSSGSLPLGVSQERGFRHVLWQVPRQQFGQRQMLVARMYDISRKKHTMTQIGVTTRVVPGAIDAAARLPKEVARAMGDILALPSSHPQRRQLLRQQSPMVRALVEGVRLTTARVDLTDARYAAAMADLRAMAVAIKHGALFLTINPADQHSGAAVVTSGELIDFDDGGRPQQLHTAVQKWRWVAQNPLACAELLRVVKDIIADRLFGFRPGAKRQYTNRCFCGLVFELVVKVEQSGRLALHLHLIAHLATFAVDRLHALFAGPNCHALALAYAVCQAWYPSPYRDPVLGDAGAIFGIPPAAASRVAQPVPEVDARCPPAAYDFLTLAGCSGSGLPPRSRLSPCKAHHACVLRSALNHGHSETCKRHGKRGVDGDCGMVFPRVVRLAFQWVGTTGLFLLPRLGPNIVPHFPALALAFGCNQLVSLVCELDRDFTPAVAAEWAKPAAEQGPAAACMRRPAAHRAHDSGYYAAKYVAKGIKRSQAANLCVLVDRLQSFFLRAERPTAAAAGGAGGSAAPAIPTAFGNVASAAHRITASMTTGLALMAFMLSGNETFESSFDRATLPVGAFAALASASAVDDEEAAAGVELVEADDGETLAVVSAVQTYQQRGDDLNGVDCSPFTFTMSYKLAAVPRAKHPHAALLSGAAPPAAHRRQPAMPAGAGGHHLAGGAGAPAPAAVALAPLDPPAIHGDVTAGPNLVALQPTHPQYLTHALRRHPRPLYVLPSGRLPRRPAPDGNRDAADRYYAFVLGNFKAYRTTPIPAGMSLRQAYEYWWDVELPRTEAGAQYKRLVKILLDNIEAEHDAKQRHQEDYNRARRERRAAGLVARDGSDADSDIDSESDLPAHLRVQPDPETGGAADPDAADEQTLDPAHSDGTTGSDLTAIPVTDLFDRTTHEGQYAYEAAARLSRPTIPNGHGHGDGRFVRRGTDNDRAQLQLAQRRLKQYQAPCAEQTGAPPAGCRGLRLQRAPSGAVVAIVLLSDREEPLTPGTPPPYVRLLREPSLEETIDLFTLSAEQAVPFLLMARYFDRCRQFQPPGDPPRLLVVGGPGTGKSQFVHALLWYTFQYGQPDWASTSAYTWTAAANFNTPVHRGLSTHAMFGLTAVPKDALKHSRDTALQALSCP
ncbi:hypothetical protein GPECTOR_59g654 [Gonium pectorale]|uniref:Helitron helicase-like domain-containing protein n=1 Tax=Gonium pectorale TaxID=33097 RepID=A0A150G585_GONPE|nr:hypothetical protein GPECTOR_59g654 [Gonium pectorale]|eukprot:KXZ45046.1 hypothetical protein GPECTOR_59g654 [Gonium pectorale]